MEIKFEKHKTENGTPVFEITATGTFETSVIEQTLVALAGEIEELSGAPFRILIDASRIKAVSEEQSKVFMDAQDLAVDGGMEKDAFVISSAITKMQLLRLSKESKRFEALGELPIFEDLPSARKYIYA